MASYSNPAAYTATRDKHSEYRATRHVHSATKYALPVRRHASHTWEGEGSYSPISASSSTCTTRGGWSEESSASSPDAGRQYLQVLTQSKPPLLHHRTYQLVVVQNPQTTAECGQNDMSRLPLAPPLFVRLVIRNSVGVEISGDAELPFLVARITLHSAGSPHPHDLSSSANLYGTTISGPHSLRDLQGAPGAYFVFPDVGIRRQGRWRLYVTLLRIARVGSATLFGDGDTSPCLAGVWTEVFDVVPQDGYIAPERTSLTRHFQSQGVRMYISNSVLPR